MNIVLYQPEIPQNTGNIIRTCAVTGSSLHIIRPMGFLWDDKKLKRSGLDYWQLLDIHFYDSLEEFLEQHKAKKKFFFTSKCHKSYVEGDYDADSMLIFGRETAGLPDWVHEKYPECCVRIPMIENENARCLNVSNAVAVAVYEALRQATGFAGMKV